MKSGCAASRTDIHDANVVGSGMANPAAYPSPDLGDFGLGTTTCEQFIEVQPFHAPAACAYGVQLKARDQIGKILHTV